MLQSELQQLLVKYVLEERARQDAQHGEMPRDMTPGAWLIVLMEEVGEVARAIIKGDSESNNYVVELIQVAAVALAAIEDYIEGVSILEINDVIDKPLKYQDNIKTLYEDENNEFHRKLYLGSQ